MGYATDLTIDQAQKEIGLQEGLDYEDAIRMPLKTFKSSSLRLILVLSNPRPLNPTD